MRWLIQAVRRFLSVLIALVIVFEEWGWEPLQRAMARLARLPVLSQLEALIVRLPSWAALLLLLLPSLLLVPIKLVALWLIAQGRPSLGVVVIVVAKLVGTAVVARLFVLTRPALMHMAWFAALYLRWSAWKANLLARVRGSWAWRVGRVSQRAARRQWARWRATLTG